MLKLLGGCLIFLGSLGLGMWYRAQFNGRIKALRELRRMLELLSGEVRYGRATLPECCQLAAGNVPPPFDEALGRIGRRIEENTGAAFGEVFREEMQPVLCELPIKSEDAEQFLHFCSQTGFKDSQMQMRALEQSVEVLESRERKLEGENGEKGRLAMGLGVLSGLLLILILW